MLKKYKKQILIITFVFLAPGISEASLIDDLKQSINAHNSQIEQLEAEINRYEKTIAETQAEAQTLDSTIKEIDYTREKLETQIKSTETKIDATELNIERLELEIGSNENKIKKSRESIANTLRKMYSENNTSLMETLLSGETLSSAWNIVAALEQFNKSVKSYISELNQEKEYLEDNREELTATVVNLADLQEDLSGQKAVADETREQKAEILEETKNKEANYQAILAEKKRLKEEFERELRNFESQLQTYIDPDRLPEQGTSILSWPLDDVYLTQYFGNTEFAQSGAYNGRGHNGIDLRASVGTKVKSAAGGTVLGIGNTDLGCPRGSYGKWVLIDHQNGLATLYAHLSKIQVGKGQSVSRGQTIAFSGNTGFSTGPHLHFTVYASQGVQIGQLIRSDGSRSSCTEMPLSPLNGYLNPLSYL